MSGMSPVHRLELRRQLGDTRRLLWLAGLTGIMAVGLMFLPDKGLALSVFLGGSLGMLVQWRGTCSAVVEIPPNAMSASTIEHWLKAKGYRDGPSAGVLKSRHPDWACFASQTIALHGHERMTRVIGPYFILKALARLAHDANPVEVDLAK